LQRELHAYEQPQARFTPLRLLRSEGRADYHFRSLVQVNFFAKPRP
jgi:hypothetical protein